MKHSNGGMRDSIKRIGLYGGVVNHVFEDNLVAHLERLVEGEIPELVARKARTSG